MAHVDHGAHLLFDRVQKPGFGVYDMDLVLLHVYAERAADHGRSEAGGVGGEGEGEILAFSFQLSARTCLDWISAFSIE